MYGLNKSAIQALPIADFIADSLGVGNANYQNHQNRQYRLPISLPKKYNKQNSPIQPTEFSLQIVKALDLQPIIPCLKKGVSKSQTSKQTPRLLA